MGAFACEPCEPYGETYGGLASGAWRRCWNRPVGLIDACTSEACWDPYVGLSSEPCGPCWNVAVGLTGAWGCGYGP